MTRLLLGFAGVILLAIVALAVIWLVGQVLVGVGGIAVGAAGVLLKVLWFLMVAALLGGLVYFVANAWRPAHQAAPQQRVKAVSGPPADLRTVLSQETKSPEAEHAQS